MLYLNLHEFSAIIMIIGLIISVSGPISEFVQFTQKFLYYNSMKESLSTSKLTVYMQFYLLFLMNTFSTGKKVNQISREHQQAKYVEYKTSK